MKRETLRHPKTFALMHLLGCSRPEALGYLTILWDYTGDIAIQGDIGKWPNAVIAQACDWNGDPDEFVGSLIESGWLDEVDSPARLIIHDWPAHCENWVRKKLERSKMDFSTEYQRKDGSSVHAKHVQTVSSQCPDSVQTTDGQRTDNGATILSEPIQSEPIPSNPSTTPAKAADIDPELLRWTNWWNVLKSTGHVTTAVVTDPPSKAVKSAWDRSRKDSEVRDALMNPAALAEAIRGSPFVNSGWFTLPKMLGGKNKDGELIINKLLDGGFKDGNASQSKIAIGPGQRHPDDVKPIGEF